MEQGKKMKELRKKIRKIIFTLVCMLMCMGMWGCESSDTDLAQSIVDSTENIADEAKEHIEDGTKEATNTEDNKEEEKQSVKGGNDKAVDNTTSINKEKYIENKKEASVKKVSRSNVPKYNGKSYVVINNNVPTFKDAELKKTSYETYSRLDKLGRCGVARANIGKDLMPKSERGSIGRVKPSGWQTVKYDIVDGKYLYNRCHLIGFQLTGENANERNLITGTRYMNVDGMLPFENMVADYIKETSNHVLYQVEPVYEGNNLVASGVYMQAKSVEDKGRGISFYVFVYNIQPGIKINYTDGTSSLVNGRESIADKSKEKTSKKKVSIPKKHNETSKKVTYVLNTSTKKFHMQGCSSASTIADKNKGSFTGNRTELINKGYDPCKRCRP